MLADLYKDELPLLNAVRCQPCVSIIMPFDPKMGNKREIARSLEIATNKINRELHKNYDNEVADEVLDNLKNVIEHLDYTTHKKSVAVYVSPMIEKIYYLNIPVTEKVMTDTSFEIRDIVRNKKDAHEFLILVISAKNGKIYIGDCERLRPVVHNHVEHMRRDLPEPVANFTDSKKIKEANLIKFLHCIDNGLSSILKSYPLPLFVMTTEKTMGYFKKLTKHWQKITGFVHGNYDDATESDLRKAFEPLIHNWKSVKEKDIFNKLAAAQNENRLAVGIYDVWKQANRKHGQLLVVEKDFYCPAFVGKSGEAIFSNKNHSELIIKDAVDDVIEKVLENGGDVEFVDELIEYQHIALIEYNYDHKQ